MSLRSRQHFQDKKIMKIQLKNITIIAKSVLAWELVNKVGNLEDSTYDVATDAASPDPLVRQACRNFVTSI